MRKTKEWSRGQKFEAEEDDEKEFDEMMDVDATTHLQRARTWGKGGKALAKGFGRKNKEQRQRQPIGHHGPAGGRGWTN